MDIPILSPANVFIYRDNLKDIRRALEFAEIDNRQKHLRALVISGKNV